MESGKSDVDHGDNQQVMSERLVHLQDASFKSAEDKDQTIIKYVRYVILLCDHSSGVFSRVPLSCYTAD